MPAPPAYMLPLARLERFPQYRHPMPVDKAYTDPRHAGLGGGVAPTLRVGDGTINPADLTVPAEFGLRARGHLGILDYARGDFDLVEYRRAPWNVVNSHMRSFWMRCLFIDGVGAGGFVDFSIEDEGGTPRNTRAVGDSSNTFASTALTDTLAVKAKYGSNGGAVDGTVTNVRTQLGQTFGMDLTLDDVLFRVNMSGSRIHTEAGGTIREIAAFQDYPDTGPTLRQHLCDITVVADTPVALNQTVATSWQWQF